MVEHWLQWAPGDGRGSKNFATFEDLQAALLRVDGFAAKAYDLEDALFKDHSEISPKRFVIAQQQETLVADANFDFKFTHNDSKDAEINQTYKYKNVF